jgi:hypothetical protein
VYAHSYEFTEARRKVPETGISAFFNERHSDHQPLNTHIHAKIFSTFGFVFANRQSQNKKIPIMKKVILALVIAASTLTANAQKEKKYAKIIYKDVKTENSDLVISVDNIVSTDAETKFKLKITNKTADYIIYKPEESKFVINGKEMTPSEKWLIISPNESDFRVINLKEKNMNTVKSYSFVVDGLYRASANAEGIPAPDFRLPPTKNDFQAGSFNVSLDKMSKESAQTDVKFKVSYNGDKIGFIFPSKAGVLMPDGNEYANGKRNASAIILTKGKDDSFTLHWDRMQGRALDMQKVEMIIKWNATFAEITPEKMKSETVEMQIDDILSK